MAGDWHEQAACRADPEAMYRDDPAGVAAARWVCAACPVRALCLADALEHREPWGMWGGHTIAERERLCSGASPADCGTCGLPHVPADGGDDCDGCAPRKLPAVRPDGVNLTAHRDTITACTADGWDPGEIAALLGTHAKSVSSAQQRWGLASSGRRGPLIRQPCGTSAAAKRHWRRKEPLCDACKRAELRRQEARKEAA